MRQWVRWLVVISVLPPAAETRAADPAKSELPPVVVTATRTEAPLEDVTTSVTVISEDDLRQRAPQTVADAVRGAPGVDVTEFGSPGHSALISLRGSAPDQVLVMLDGVKVNSPTVGQFDFANLTTENLGRIEILRGGGGALYGSEAIGGVINAMTRRGEGPWRVAASEEAGSGATHHEVLSLNGAQGPVALSGSAAFLASDGFRSINDDYRNFSTVWRADAEVLPGATLRGFVRYINSRAGLVNFNVAEGILDPDAHSRSDFFLAKGEWEQALTASLTSRATVSFVRDNERFRDDPNETGEPIPEVLAHFPSEIVAADTQWDYRWRELALTTIGLEFNERSAHIFKQEEDEAPEMSNPNRSNVAVYAQEQVNLWGEALRGVGGVRYDRIDGFGDEVTWSGSGLYHVEATNTRVRLGYAEGFRAPTFDELFEPELGNPNLRSEHSWEINAGIAQEWCDGRLRLAPTYFYRRVANLIEEVADQLPGPIAGVPEEAGAFNVDARFHGVELATHAQLAPWLTLSGSYTYLHFDTPVLFNRPNHRGSAVVAADRGSVVVPGDRGTIALIVHAVGRRDSADPRADFEPGEVAGYARTDLTMSYRFADRLAPVTLTASVRNLFDRDYEESIGFPAPPARFLIGVRYQMP
jgi:vitamin B12 transporter